MSAGDNTKDDRWRPGFASSERRVREELADAATEAGCPSHQKEVGARSPPRRTSPHVSGGRGLRNQRSTNVLPWLGRPGYGEGGGHSALIQERRPRRVIPHREGRVTRFGRRGWLGYA